MPRHAAARRPPPSPLLGVVPFDPERLDVYDAVTQFHRVTAVLPGGRGAEALREELDRASRSVLFNVAEAANRPLAEDRARFDARARACAQDCAALVDRLRAHGFIAPDRAARARSLMVRAARMLTGLARRWRQRGGAPRRTGWPRR
ncbi:MAG TPA: four helix bundle protein [Vicinamibacteria bacterium]|nr:four helix bundle protein [Vicinamibacteria bacterium]